MDEQTRHSFVTEKLVCILQDFSHNDLKRFAELLDCPVCDVHGLAEFRASQIRDEIRNRHPWKHASQTRLRYMALRKAIGKCQLCGATAQDGAVLQVDHIKPVSRYPELKHDLNNFQVLCRDCNIGKGQYFSGDDWRTNR